MSTYGSDPHGQPSYGAPGFYAPVPAYSHWGMRALARVIDTLLSLAASFPLFVGYVWLMSASYPSTNPDGTVTRHFEDPSPAAITLVVAGAGLAIGFSLWNICVRQGRTGATLGKRAVGIRLVKELTGRPVGVGMAFVRQLAHIADELCYIGYLWPLWDAKRQTFADKIVGTIVINEKTAP
ncbi:RDD family protein [Nocardioides sp.]|uniref:RDD family protein n=1 Tax=Nocardioides sp. TaxID=35761 RepID=UPI0031FED480|nr:domain containing protein [Nocardioides sp.]